MEAIEEIPTHPLWVDALRGYVAPYWQETLNGR